MKKIIIALSFVLFLTSVVFLLTYEIASGSQAQTVPNQANISSGVYAVLSARTTSNQNGFFVYHDQDDGLNHGFPSGFFGAIDHISLDAGCIDDPTTANGCSTDTTRLDRTRGTVLRITIAPLSPQTFAGVNIEEPENWGVLQTGNGYDLRGANNIVFDVRSPTASKFQFGVGRCVSNFVAVPTSWTTMSIPLSSLQSPSSPPEPCPPALDQVHVLFTAVTDSGDAPNGGTVLLDNIHYDPTPTSHQFALGFPVGNQTFGVVPLQTASAGRVPIPSDQVLRNLTTIYESALAEFVFLARGTPSDLSNAQLIANTFDYTLHHESHGDPLPTATVGSNTFVGAHSGYENGDIGLFNDQSSPKQGKAGDVRLAGFTASQTLCGPSGFCLVLDGATGGNNAFEILALVAAFRQFQDLRYLNDARDIGNWIIANLADTSGTGFGGYFLGYPDQGQAKVLILGKSIENNADIFSAMTALATIETQLGNTSAATTWTNAANVAGDFVMQMFDSTNGRFNTGTVPVGTPASPGICPNGAQKGNDVINTCDFIDADTFTTLALATAPRYQNQIDWRLPVRYALNNFAQTVTAGSQTFSGFDIVTNPTAGPNGIAWEFTGQQVLAMHFIDQITGQTEFENAASSSLTQIGNAQKLAPFGDGQGLVASTMQNGDTLSPLDQCLSTPFQCIPERVGLASSTWAVLAEQNLNVFNPLPLFSITSTGPQSVTITAGQIATYNLSVASVGSFHGSVSLNCSGAPANSQCAVSPSAVTLSGQTPQTFTVTVSTMPHTTSGKSNVWRGITASVVFGLGMLWFGSGLSKKNPNRPTLAVLITILVIAALAFGLESCGGGGGGMTGRNATPTPTPTPTPNPTTGTPAGTYTITTGGNGGFSATSTNLTLIVQ
jgi:hypothetical protein